MRKNILVADDDAGMRGLYQRIFSGQNYALTLAGSFSEAARLIEANTYDLLITDLMLQDGLGTELILFFTQRCTNAKSLLVTGSPGAEATQTCPGTTQYFVKPLNIGNFMAVVAKALNN